MDDKTCQRCQAIVFLLLLFSGWFSGDRSPTLFITTSGLVFIADQAICESVNLESIVDGSGNNRRFVEDSHFLHQQT